jgi:hypothetical protein
MIFIMMLIMMWQTFPLRYGLIGQIFSEFKWTFLLVLAFIGKALIIISDYRRLKRHEAGRSCGG